MTNINNKNVNPNNEMTKHINSLIKKIIKEDDVNTLLSMIDNGLDINIFKYKNKTGINAIILYKYDNNKESVGSVIGMLLTRFQYLEDLQKDIANKLEELSYNDMANYFKSKTLNKEKFNLEDIVSEFKGFLEALTEEDSTKEADTNKTTEDNKDNSIDSKDVENTDRGYLVYKEDDESKDISNGDISKDEQACKGYLSYIRDVNTENNISNVDALKEENFHKEHLAYKEPNEIKKEFHMIGDINYKVSSISAYVTLENEDTCETKQVSIQVSNMEEFSYVINKEIEQANNENNEKLANSIIEMMNTNSQFKQNLLELMKEAQLSK